MEKKSIFSKKIVATIIAIAILVGGGLALKNVFVPNHDGEIKVSIVDIKGTTINEKNITFDKGDALVDLLKDNFDNVVVDNGMLMSIDTLTTPEDWSQFISIYVDDEMSQVGLLEIQYQDGTKISFIMTENTYAQ